MSKWVMRKKSEEELNTITKEVVRQILNNENLHISKIILYGSYARGDANDESDIDIMVLCDNREEELDRLRYEANVISSRISLENDVDVAMTLKDEDIFTKWVEVLPFYKNVVDEGVVLYG